VPSDSKVLVDVDAWWRAANYLSVGQIYLLDNPLLHEPLRPEHIKPRLLGHWGTTPGLNFLYAHLNRIIVDRDVEMLYVTGPGHGGPGLVDYARRLHDLAERVADTLYLVMRVYFEKPRTTTGWKGLVNDPRMDDSFLIQEGLHIARRLLLDINELGLPTATEALDPISPQYLQDLIAWSAIGARTAESQKHR
jgi:hypothetical protein